MSLVKKTYHCKVIRLTNTKQVALQQEYDNLQHYLQTREDRGLYSANKQQANRYYKIIKKTTKYPLSIRNDLIRLEHDPSNIAEYWVRVTYTIQRITSDASTIVPIYLPPRLSSRIVNLPPLLCIIFAFITTLFIDTTDQHERLSSASLRLLLLPLNSSAHLFLPNLKEIVLITCLIKCNR